MIRKIISIAPEVQIQSKTKKYLHTDIRLFKKTNIIIIKKIWKRYIINRSN